MNRAQMNELRWSRRAIGSRPRAILAGAAKAEMLNGFRYWNEVGQGEAIAGRLRRGARA